MAKSYTVFWFVAPASIENLVFDSLDEAIAKVNELIEDDDVPREHIFMLDGKIIGFTYGVVLEGQNKRRPSINKDGTPRKKPGRKPREATQSNANGADVVS